MRSERCSLVVHEQLAPKRTFAKKKATTMSQITCSQQQQQSVCFSSGFPTRALADEVTMHAIL